MKTSTSFDGKVQPASLFRAALACEDGVELARLARQWERRTVRDTPDERPPLRLAVLGQGSVETYLPQLRLLCAARGFPVRTMTGAFEGISQDILAPESKVYGFKPDIALIHLLPVGMASPPPVFSEEEQAGAAATESGRILGLCRILHERAGCEIVLTNFEPPWQDPGAGLPPGSGSLTHHLQRVNLLLARDAPAFVRVMDVGALVSWMGQDRWHDARWWHHAKQPMSHDGMTLFTKKFAGLLAAIRGAGAKCLALDLDNTLWGGIIGDDGVEGIRLGEGSAEGEAYKTFQIYLKGLKERGILLAVCSKNDEANARRPFASHPETVLKLDDFCCFMANWEPKADNCLKIAAALNILPDALVFVDDDAAEREMVRQFVPQVRVVDLPEDASLFPRVLERTFAFETISLTSEDLRRTASYRAEQERQRLATQITDLDAFLKSLEMTATAGPYAIEDVSRITQLFNRSNQFNLCTRRYTEQQIRDLAGDSAGLAIQIRLRDRFGDHGLIAMAHFRPVSAQVMRLENWVMSCRVLNRGVEQLMCNLMASEACKRGVETLEFDYIPTPKNGLVADLYARLGFARAGVLEDGEQRWTLNARDFRPFHVRISVQSLFP